VTPGRSEELSIEITDSPKGARILRIGGPLTMRTLFEFQDAARRESSKPLILDIVSVPYMDSTGFGAVVSVFASCQRTKRGFGLVGVSPRIQTLFEVTHCEGLLPCFPDLDSADAAVNA
jgi:anti-anti-sigma factor